MNNFDDSLGLHWYRRLNGNRNEAFASKALSFGEQVSRCLGIKTPSIHWFEKADQQKASECWSDSEDAQPSPTDDPIPHACEYFRLSDQSGIVHVGVTPFDSPGYILIQIDLPFEVTLRAIADEVYHLFQDHRQGPEWRKANYDLAEEQAAHFSDSLMPEIRTFLSAVGLTSDENNLSI